MGEAAKSGQFMAIYLFPREVIVGLLALYNQIVDEPAAESVKQAVLCTEFELKFDVFVFVGCKVDRHRLPFWARVVSNICEWFLGLIDSYGVRRRIQFVMLNKRSIVGTDVDCQDIVGVWVHAFDFPPRPERKRNFVVIVKFNGWTGKGSAV